MEEITIKIEKHRSYLQNLINTKNSLSDFEIVEESQKLDKHLNIYHYATMNKN